MRTKVLVPLAVACLVVGGCGSEDDGPSAVTEPPASTATPALTPTPTPSVTAHPSPTLMSACPNEATARSDETLRHGGSVTGDVDGDGTEEEVWVALDPAASSAPCSAFVVVRSQDGTLRSTALDFQEFGPGFPRLHGLVNVNVAPGSEIVVDVTGGASTRFLAIYVVSGNTVVQMLPRGADEAERGVFGYGGSVGHLDGIDCVEGNVVVSSAVPAGEGTEYRVTRRDYRPEGLILVLAGAPQRERVEMDELGSYPEFSAGPLASCPEG